MIKTSAAALTLLMLISPAAVRADDAPPSDRFEDRARRALDLLSDEIGDILRGLGEGLERLDDYGPPQILPNGDILIPRKREAAPPETPSIDL